MDDIQRAIEDLKKMLEYPRFREVHGEYYENAISGLEELQKYRQIGELVHMKVYKAIAEKITSDMCADFKNLDELIEYRNIGTPEECREAVEKQRAKKPTYDGDEYAPDGSFVWDEWLCPHCGSRYDVDYDDYDYCPNCGQHIDWREENDGHRNNDKKS